MDKISGIIPSSARVMAVDMKEAPPIRPGTPSFGRPEGVSALRGPPEIEHGPLDWHSKDMQHAEVAKRLTDGFFMHKQAASAAPTSNSKIESDEESKSEMRPELRSDLRDEIPTIDLIASQPEGLYPKGSFLNRMA
jgi:hypothetical protein